MYTKGQCLHFQSSDDINGLQCFAAMRTVEICWRVPSMRDRSRTKFLSAIFTGRQGELTLVALFAASAICSLGGDIPADLRRALIDANQRAISGRFEFTVTVGQPYDSQQGERHLAKFLEGDLEARKRGVVRAESRAEFEARIRKQIDEAVKHGANEQTNRYTVAYRDAKNFRVEVRMVAMTGTDKLLPPVVVERRGDILCVLAPERKDVYVYDLHGLSEQEIKTIDAFHYMAAQGLSELISWLQQYPLSVDKSERANISSKEGADKLIDASLEFEDLRAEIRCDSLHGLCPLESRVQNVKLSTLDVLVASEPLEVVSGVWKPKRLLWKGYASLDERDEPYMWKAVAFHSVDAKRPLSEDELRLPLDGVEMIVDRRMPEVRRFSAKGNTEETMRNYFFRSLTEKERKTRIEQPLKPTHKPVPIPSHLGVSQRILWILITLALCGFVVGLRILRKRSVR